MDSTEQAAELLVRQFGVGGPVSTVMVPGRVNLIGEHVDYHNLPVLPMGIQRKITVAFRPRADCCIRAVSALGGEREFDWTARLEPSTAGDWVNYVKAAAQAVCDRWGVGQGIDAAVISDLPPAAGLSSSSALLTAFTLALLRANDIEATFEELMQVLPEGEYFVGTRGGGMDHATVLAARAGCALLVQFDPIMVEPVEIPPGWRFLIAHSLTTAEKSGAVRDLYNRRRVSGNKALERLGLESYRHVPAPLISELGSRLPDEERNAFLHVAGEAIRVGHAVSALRTGDVATFGRLLNESHASLRDMLEVSCRELDTLVDAAVQSGAAGARMTGAGFGGCAIAFCENEKVETLREGLLRSFYTSRPGFDPDNHLIIAEPSAGALFV